MRSPPSARLAALGVLAIVCLMALTPPVAAQIDSREAIALQNQILQLRNEVEQLRRGGVAVAPAPGGRGGGGEISGALLERVGRLEEEVRRMRGRLDELDFANRQMAQALEKLQGDMDFRLQQLEGTGGGARPAPARPVAPPPSAAPAAPLPPIAGPTPVPAAPPSSAPRTPERAIADGQAALGRGDFAGAEAAAREALRSRGIGPRTTDAQMLLAASLAGKRDFAGAALAYNEAYSRNRSGPRAPEALLGLASSFNSLGNRREACETLGDLRSNFPSLRGPVADRAQALRQRAGCR
jgi:TolA-binding protein